MNADDEFLDIKAACKLIGGSKPISPASFYRGVAAGIYSPPVKVAPNASRVLKSRLLADLARLIEVSDNKSNAA